MKTKKFFKNGKEIMIHRICITGGPCAGKTTILTRISHELDSIAGMPYALSPEAATVLMEQEGIAMGQNGVDAWEFQKLILLKQREQEDLIIEELSKYGNAVMLCDRGMMDGRAYLSHSEFDRLLTICDAQNEDMMYRYNMVLHLPSVVKHHPEAYVWNGNAGELAMAQMRRESPEEALALDKATEDAWYGHGNHIIVDGSGSLDDTYNKVIETMEEFILNREGAR